MRIPKTYEEAVEILTLSNSDDELASGDLEMFFFPCPFHRVVRLLSVSDNYPDFENEDFDASPISIGASKEFPFPASFCMCVRSRWLEILSGESRLPIGWDISRHQKVWPRTNSLR